MDGMIAFTERVTLCEDGFYRWHYDMDMRNNRFLLRFLMKVMSLVMGIICLTALIMFSESSAFGPGMAMWIIGLCGGLILLTWAGYWVAVLVMKGSYRLHFEMNEETIALVHKPETQRLMHGIAVAALLTGSGTALSAAASSGRTSFSIVRRMKEFPEWDVLTLQSFLAGNQIWIPKEDYSFVRDFISSHVSPGTVR